MLPTNHWWKLREKFKQSIPGIVTDSYLASVLAIQKNSAQANVLPALRQIKLIDNNGKTLEIAKDWRDDQKYASVCEKFRKSIYPQELFDAFSDPTSEREGVIRWFANQTGNGDTAVKKMVAFYLLLVEASIEKKTDGKSVKKASSKKAAKKSTVQINKEAEKQNTSLPPKTKSQPDVNINMQIHISSDATADQIDKIFESMSKHIYREK
jgi:hypothetical protein